jgi:hypothetical protein
MVHIVRGMGLIAKRIAKPSLNFNSFNEVLEIVSINRLIPRSSSLFWKFSQFIATELREILTRLLERRLLVMEDEITDCVNPCENADGAKDTEVLPHPAGLGFQCDHVFCFFNI